jgi:hypothetical protein
MKDEYYSSKAARLDTVIGDNKRVWLQILSARKEWGGNIKSSGSDFYNWLEETYGLRLNLTPSGEWTLINDIVDHDKYLIFLLKHGGSI